MEVWRVERLKEFDKQGSASQGSFHPIPSTATKMEQLSGVMIIIIIGGGVLTFVTLFVFAKRQIMRFTLRSRRGPHVPVGADSKKALRREIERRLDCIPKIAQEPKLLWTEDKYIVQPDKLLPAYYYRMRAVDDVKLLEREIEKSDSGTRGAYESLRAFLLTTLASTLNGSGQRMIHQFCDMYEHARHDPNEFGQEEYEAYHRLLMKLMDAAKQLMTYNCRRTSPARTPKKQTKMHSLLDPSRLRPPPMTTPSNNKTDSSSDIRVGQQSKVNLTLGLQGCDSLDLNSSSEIATNPLHLQTSATERDIIIRSRLKTPKLNLEDVTLEDDCDQEDDNEIRSISAMQQLPIGHHSNASVV